MEQLGVSEEQSLILTEMELAEFTIQIHCRKYAIRYLVCSIGDDPFQQVQTPLVRGSRRLRRGTQHCVSSERLPPRVVQKVRPDDRCRRPETFV